MGLPPRTVRGYRNIPNPAHYKIRPARDRAKTALIDLRESASRVPAQIKKVKVALEVAELNTSGKPKERFSYSKTYLWISLEDALDRALKMSRAIVKVPRGEDDGEDEDGDWGRKDKWDRLKGLSWVREIPRWNTSISEILTALDRAIGTLDHWRRFDSDN
jgi:hypothetical protein